MIGKAVWLVKCSGLEGHGKEKHFSYFVKGEILTRSSFFRDFFFGGGLINGVTGSFQSWF